MATFLSEFGLALFDGRHDHVASGGCGESIEAGTKSNDGDDVEICKAR